MINYYKILKGKIYILLPLILASCIGEDIIFDFVGNSIKITNAIESIKVGEMHQLEAMYFNAVGVEENVPISWESLSPSIISVSDEGEISALAEGEANIVAYSQVSQDTIVSDTVHIVAGSETVVQTERSGTLKTTSSYTLEGDFVLKDIGGGALVLELAENFKASSTLPGLYVYLTNNPNTNNGALEISLITKFTGASTFNIPNGTDLNEHSHVLFYCKPFVVKVGDGEFDN